MGFDTTYTRLLITSHADQGRPSERATSGSRSVSSRRGPAPRRHEPDVDLVATVVLLHAVVPYPRTVQARDAERLHVEGLVDEDDGV